MRSRASQVRPPRLVGRAAELDELAQAWAAGRVFLLVGEAGAGKTRLLQEFAQRRGPGRCLHVAARPGDDGVPFSLLARLLRAARDTRPGVQADAPTRRELARLMPELEPAVEPGGMPQAEALQRAIEWQLQAAAQAGTAELLVDDLQFADDASLHLLRQVLLDARPLGCRFGLAQRPEADGRAASALGEALRDTQRLHLLRLRPLDLAAMAELIDSLGLPGLRDPALPARILGHSGGNPLFALETLKDLQWSGPRADGLPRPATVTQLIERRLRMLSAPAMALARVAALAGADFDIALAEAVLGTPALQLADPWLELQLAQVFAAAGFAHDLMQEAVRASVPQEIARHVHAGLADHLQRRRAEPAACAAHWHAAGRHAEAARAWRAAARRALALGRRDEECDFRARAAAAHRAAGEPDEAFEAEVDRLEAVVNVQGVEAALVLAESLRPQAIGPDARARLHLRFAQLLLWAGRHAEAAQEAEAALRAGGSDEQVRADAVLALADCLAFQGRAAHAADLLQEQLARGEGPATRTRARLHGSLVRALLYANRRRDALPVVERHLALAEACGEVDERNEALASLSIVLIALGEGERAVATAARLHDLELALEADTAARWIHDGNFGRYLTALGRYGPALQILEPALERLRTLMPGSPWTSTVECFLADCFVALGQPGRASALVAGGDAGHPGFLRARRLYAQALALEAMGQPAARRDELLAAALPLSSGDAGLPMRLAIRIERTPFQPADAAAAECAALAVEAELAEMPLEVLHARQRQVEALLRAGRIDEAGPVAALLAAGLRRVEGCGLHPPAAWLACARAAEAAGAAERVAEALAAGCDWVEHRALPHVPEPFRASFLDRHPVHHALRAWSRRLARR